MLRARSTFAILAVFTVATALNAQPTSRVDALVRKLGSDSFVQREQARKELIAIGPSTLDTLRRGVKSAEPETAGRIANLIAHFEEQLLTKEILTPKMIDIKLEGVTVQEAIADITKKSGYPIQFMGDATPFANKKITLTGKMAFWEAVDRLCEQGGLMEQIDMNSGVNPYPNPYSGRFNRNIYVGESKSTPAGPMKLTIRSGKESPISRAGSIKTEARVTRDAKTKELVVTLIAGVEPSLLNSHITGRPVIAKLFDEEGHKLAASFDPAPQRNDPNGMQYIDFNAMAGPAPTRIATMRVKDDGKRIAELAGSLTMQLDLQNVVLARIEKVMDAAGKSVAGANGGTLKIDSILLHPNKSIEIDVVMQNLTSNPFGNAIVINRGNVIIRGNINGNIVINGGNVRINGNGTAKDLPDLIDAKGQKYRIANVKRESTNAFNGAITRSATVVYQPASPESEPRELILQGTRTHTIAVPFRFENLQAP
ncbi:MAG TPA: hypothetical protein VFE62_18750 [Gemmataceae bacterium]|nr:hypothetical protein [Gemmataceae bacterium]